MTPEQLTEYINSKKCFPQKQGQREPSKNSFIQFFRIFLDNTSGIFCSIRKTSSTFFRSILSVANRLPEYPRATTLLLMMKIFVVYFLFGWWVSPLVGLASITLNSIILQLKVISFLLFGQINSKNAGITKRHFRENRMGLTLMCFIMIIFSGITSLKPRTMQSLSAILVLALLVIKCCI